MDMVFTGECFIPGLSPERLEEDHVGRYVFASNYVVGKNVLDIACGAGYGADLLINNGAASVTAVDISENNIRYASHKYDNPNIYFKVEDICELTDKENYDVIVCFETIEHVVGYKKAILNLYKALKPGGVVIISSPNREVTSPGAKNLLDKPSNEFHTQEFLVHELIEELNIAGFVVKKDDVYGQRLKMPKKALARLISAFTDSTKIEGSANVQKVGLLVPRYFVVIARKA